MSHAASIDRLLLTPWETADVRDFILRILPTYGAVGKLEALAPGTVLLRMALTAVQSQTIFTQYTYGLGEQVKPEPGPGDQDAGLDPSLPLSRRVQQWMEMALDVMDEELERHLELMRGAAESGALARFLRELLEKTTHEVPRKIWQLYLRHLPTGPVSESPLLQPPEVVDTPAADLAQEFESLRRAWTRWPALNATPWLPFLSDLRRHYDLCDKAACWPTDPFHDSSSVIHSMAHAMCGTVPMGSRYTLLRHATLAADQMRRTLFGPARPRLEEWREWGLAQYWSVLLALPLTRAPTPMPLFMVPVWPHGVQSASETEEAKGLARIYARGAAFPGAGRGEDGGFARSALAYPPIQNPKLPQCVAMLAQNATILGDKQRFVLASFLAQCAPSDVHTLQEALDWVQPLAQEVELTDRARQLMHQRAGVADRSKARERLDYMEATFIRDRGDAKIFSCSRIIHSPIEGRADIYDLVICPHASGHTGDIEDLAKQACAVHCGVAPADAAQGRKHFSMATLWANGI